MELKFANGSSLTSHLPKVDAITQPDGSEWTVWTVDFYHGTEEVGQMVWMEKTK